MSLFESASLIVTPNGVKEDKLYSIKPTDGSGDLVVTRATTATRVNSAGLIESVASNVPRLDYSNGTCPSILVEPQRTNLCTYSEQFDNAAWSTKDNLTITANAITAPDGTSTADKLVENTSNSTHRVFRTLGGTNNVFSFYAKAGERSWVSVLTFSSYAYFNVSNGTLGSIPAGTTATITNAGNGWYRCTLTNFHPSFTLIGISTADNVTSYLGDGTSGLYVWGAQVEAGSYATSYIKTEATTVTRNADVISKTGISSLIGQTEGTMYAEIKAFETTNELVKRTISLSDGTNNNRIYISFDEDYNKLNFTIIVNNTTVTLADIVISNQNTYNKIAIKYKSGDSSIYINGVLKSSFTTTFSSGIFNQLKFSNRGTGEAFIGNCNMLSLWKTALTNDELETLTTL